jgi:hypothetical protein
MMPQEHIQGCVQENVQECINISLDNVKYTKKPEKWEIAGISNRVGSGIQQLDSASIKSFAENVGQHGISFAPATFKNGVRKVEAFEQMQLLALDFDNGVTLAEVMGRTKKYDLPILFAYETFTSINQNKFRVAFLNNASIDDVRLAKISQNALMEIFPEADRACKDVSQMYFGGKRLLYFDETIPAVDTELLLRNMTFYMKNRRGPTHYKTHIRKFANRHNIKLSRKGLLDIVPTENPESFMKPEYPAGSPFKVWPENDGVSHDCKNSDESCDCRSSGISVENKNGKISPKSFIIYKTTCEFLPNSSNTSNTGKTNKTYFHINLNEGYTDNSVQGQNARQSFKQDLGFKQTAGNRNHKGYRACDIKNIERSCRLYREFLAGERRMHHDELFGIATNIIQVETGTTVFKDILSSYPDYYDDAKQEKWDFHIKYINEHNYRPQRCDNFCPYRDSCRHTSNILTTAKPKYGTMERVSGFEEIFCTVDEAHEDLRQKLIEAIGSEDVVGPESAETQRVAQGRYLRKLPHGKLRHK